MYDSHSELINLTKLKDLLIVVSHWKNPLPLKENASTKVMICLYDNTWIPITFSNLAEALKLYQTALLHGAEIFVFPPDSTPGSSTIQLLNSPLVCDRSF